MKNSGLMAFGTLGAILLGFIAPLIVWLNKDKLTPEERAIAASFFNFEISLLLVCIVINFIPVIGQIIGFVLGIVNIVYAVMAFIAVKNNKPFNALNIYEFVK